MRAYRVHEFGGADQLRIEERPDPNPGPGQVVVRVEAVSLNFRDLMVLKGQYNPKLARPFVPVSDASGVVLEVGPGVSRWKPGDRVAPIFLQGWLEGPPSEAKAKTALGGGLDGVLSERVVVDEQGLVRLPDHLSFEEGATLPCAGVTAWHALFAEEPIRPGETVLLQGTGGVSIFALQFARAAGARIIQTSGSDEKLERARALGASELINYKTNPDWEKAARALTDGLGVDQVVEVGGAGTLPRSLRAVRTGGRISLIGVLTGTSGALDLTPALMRNIRIQGIFVGSRAMFEGMNRAIALHQIHPVVDRVFAFERAAEAYRHLESGAHFGKVVIRVGEG